MLLKDQLTVHIDDAIQKIFYSGKQKQHTVKNILFTDVGGYVHF
jgi:flagellar basal body-associated protein FliL